MKEDGPTEQDRIAWAMSIWRATAPLPGTAAGRYLFSRGIHLGKEDLSHVLRFHPALKYGETRTPAMVALMRDVRTDEPCGAHRTFLTPDGRKLDRRMLGRSRGAAVKLDADAEVSVGLHIGEGIETVLSARQLGYRPAWAMGSADAIANLPVLFGVEALTVFAENDDASARAAEAACERWERAGREAWMVEPPAGDFNDVAKLAPR